MSVPSHHSHWPSCSASVSPTHRKGNWGNSLITPWINSWGGSNSWGRILIYFLSRDCHVNCLSCDRHVFFLFPAQSRLISLCVGELQSLPRVVLPSRQSLWSPPGCCCASGRTRRSRSTDDPPAAPPKRSSSDSSTTTSRLDTVCTWSLHTAGESENV